MSIFERLRKEKSLYDLLKPFLKPDVKPEDIQLLTEAYGTIDRIRFLETVQLIKNIETINTLNTVSRIGRIGSIESIGSILSLPNIIISGSENIPFRQTQNYVYTWVKPSSHEQTDWSNPQNAYDNNEASYTSVTVPRFSYSSFLVLNFNEFFKSDAVYFHVGHSGSPFDFPTIDSPILDIDVYDGSNWIDLFNVYIFPDDTRTLSFSQKTISKIRFRFLSTASNTLTFYIYETSLSKIINTSALVVVGREEVLTRSWDLSAGQYTLLGAVSDKRHKVYGWDYEVDADGESCFVGVVGGISTKFGRRVTKGVHVRSLFYPIVLDVNTSLGFISAGNTKLSLQYSTE